MGQHAAPSLFRGWLFYCALLRLVVFSCIQAVLSVFFIHLFHKLKQKRMKAALQDGDEDGDAFNGSHKSVYNSGLYDGAVGGAYVQSDTMRERAVMRCMTHGPFSRTLRPPPTSGCSLLWLRMSHFLQTRGSVRAEAFCVYLHATLLLVQV